MLTWAAWVGAAGVWTLPDNNWMTDASMVVRHKGHSLFCAWIFEARHWRWNLWLHDRVTSGLPGAKVLRQIVQSSTVDAESSADGEGSVSDMRLCLAKKWKQLRWVSPYQKESVRVIATQLILMLIHQEVWWNVESLPWWVAFKVWLDKYE